MIEVDKIYTTKFATQEKFTVKRIQEEKDGNPKIVFGIYEKAPHLGECPLNIERLIDPDKTKDVPLCRSCKRPLDE